MAKTLDRNRDYGEVLGGGVARFEQDGALFDADGKKLKAGSAGSSATAVEAADDDESGFADPPAPVASNAAPEPSELDQQLAAQGVL